MEKSSKRLIVGLSSPGNIDIRGASLAFRLRQSHSQTFKTNSKQQSQIHLYRSLSSNSCSLADSIPPNQSITSSEKKMDTCVPSPNLINTPFETSPHSLSIYEPDRQSIFCRDAKLNSNSNNMDVYGYNMDDSCLLDDNIEYTSLKSMLTPEVINSINASSSSGSVFTNTNLWDSKLNTEFQDPCADTPLHGMLISDLLNMDSNDSKFSMPFDFDFTSNPSSSCHTPVPSESKFDFLEPDRINFASHNNGKSENVGQDLMQKKFTSKSNFPPRKSEPPVGVVAPVKNPKENTVDIRCNVKREMDCDQLKSSVKKGACAVGIDTAELPPQTVPSFGSPNQKLAHTIKAEPMVPDFHIKRESVKRLTDDKWEEEMNYMHHDTLSPTKSKRRRFDSGSSVHTSEDGDEYDNDYTYNNDDDSDDDNSDIDADLAHMKPGECESLIGGGKKQKQYFWQYNVQAKGPKGTRLKLAVGAPTDPHILNGFEDPVFDECNTTVAGIRHGGKARKGDGNEVTPNPHKLFKIGHQLLRLNKKINACQLGSDVPVAKRNESRKEKNKLASRACRLKKKAQHEANKIKLNGLEMEHGHINNVLRLIWPKLRERAKELQNEKFTTQNSDPGDSLTSQLTGYISSNLKSMVAGNTTDYVNNVILTVEKGDLSGGLKVKTRKT